ncbi:hypothetical protein SP15_283 [Bacillus phage SP-15]|uniref:Uncharacterized protein n=1 Tax=Bacillus phage SP-15 TaxID=1792032 RepID=A0A127AZ72_9CAUD|nr:hypothetical protein SP15_283 [Bacillus phage SP-15]AMM45091.1 hypothetical protein SP15_283 [Bacillus phage SP-15]
MKKCSYPGCDYTASYEILNSHAKSHGFRTTKEMEKEHGLCKIIEPSSKASKWARTNTVAVTNFHYNSVTIARLK